MNQRIKNVVVLGGGSAGFLSAVTLKRLLPQLNVTVVYSSKVPVIGVGESTTAYLPRFLHRTLQLDQREFQREVQPIWKLGIRFEWGAKGDSHFNYTFDGILQVRPDPLRKRTSYYCLEDWHDAGHFSSLMDRALAPCYRHSSGQFQLQSGYGYHINNERFLRYLAKKAERLGVQSIDGEVIETPCDETGNVKHLKLADGREINAELFVDCSGFASLLLSKAQQVPHVPYDKALFCDRAAVGSWANDGLVQPFTTSETMDHGWCWRIDFADRITRGYVYSSAFCSDDEAIAEMKQKNPKLGEVRIIRFPSGRYQDFWVNNVVAIGNASGFVEPLEATALHLIAQQLTSVCGVLLDANFQLSPTLLREENRQYRRAWDEVRDFLALHYKFNHWSDSPFWQHCRKETDLGDVQPLVEMYREVGPHRSCEGLIPLESMFRFDGYLAMLIGQRVETDYRNDFTAADHADWNRFRDRVRADVSHAMPVREALSVIDSPQFLWPQ